MSGQTESAKALYNRLLGRIRMRHLQLLVEISETGSIQAAADHVGLTQPSATHAIREIEGLLGVELFVRHSRGVKPNEFGMLVIAYARSSLMGLQRSTETLVALRENETTVLRIGAIEAAARFLCSTLPQFSRRRPGIELQVTEDYGRNLLPQLISGQLDLVLSRYTPDCPGKLECVELTTDKAVVVASPFHLLAQQTVIALDDLFEYAWVVAPEGTVTRGLFNLLSKDQYGPRAAPICTTSMPLVAELLKDHRYIALLPQTLADELIEWSAVKVLNTNLHSHMPTSMAGIALFRNSAIRSEPLMDLHASLIEGSHLYPSMPTVLS